MKNTKRRFEVFSFFDYTGIAGHLSKMARKGWLIEKISNTGWIYQRIAPQKLNFFISYFPNASEFDPAPTEEQQTFYDFCMHTGWKLAASSAQMQIFYNEQKNPVPIETDPVTQTAAIHAAAKKSFVPAHLFLLFISIVNIICFVQTWSHDLVGLLADNANLFAGFAWLMLLVTALLELCSYFIWYAKARKLAERGEFTKTFSCFRLRISILAAVFAGYAYWLISVLWQGSALLKTASISMILYLAALIFIVNGIKQFMKRRHVPRNTNRIITVLSCLALSIVMISSITFAILRASQNGLFDRGIKTYAFNGAVFPVYQDKLPLTVEHLLDTAHDGYIKECRSKESLFLGQYEIRQYPRYDMEDFADMPELAYTITEVKLPFLYDYCKNSILQSEQDETIADQTVFISHYEPTDPEPWHAADAYRLYWSDGFSNRYLLCYKTRIIIIRFSWEPSSEQMSAAAERLNQTFQTF